MKQIIVTFTLDIEDDDKPQKAIDRAEAALSNAFYAVTFVESTEIGNEEVEPIGKVFFHDDPRNPSTCEAFREAYGRNCPCMDGG